MKFRLKRILIYLFVTCIVLVGVWSSHRFFVGSDHLSGKRELSAITTERITEYQPKLSGYHPIDCVINDEYPISCLKGDKDEVYVPFSFLKKYFEINGKLVSDELGSESFSWQHSYSKGL